MKQDNGNASNKWESLVNADMENKYLRNECFEACDMSGINLKYADLTNANLANANLEGADLRFATLTGARLTGANLTGARLEEANLTDVQAEGANFTNTSLKYVNMRRANLNNTNFTQAYINFAVLKGSYLIEANFTDVSLVGTNLSGVTAPMANFTRANLRQADMSNSFLIDANFANADLCEVCLTNSNVKCADFSNAHLTTVTFSGANLSQAKNILSAIDFITTNFETVKDGIIVYKTFNMYYTPPTDWIIEPGSIITENVNMDRSQSYGCGINVATRDYIYSKCETRDCNNVNVWKLLIRWEWLCGVCVPYDSTGYIRCEKAQLLEIIDIFNKRRFNYVY